MNMYEGKLIMYACIIRETFVFTVFRRVFHSILKLELCRHACRRRDQIIPTCRYGKNMPTTALESNCMIMSHVHFQFWCHELGIHLHINWHFIKVPMKSKDVGQPKFRRIGLNQNWETLLRTLFGQVRKCNFGWIQSQGIFFLFGMRYFFPRILSINLFSFTSFTYNHNLLPLW